MILLRRFNSAASLAACFSSCLLPDERALKFWERKSSELDIAKDLTE